MLEPGCSRTLAGIPLLTHYYHRVAYPLLPGITMNKVQLELVQRETATGHLRGAAAYLAEGLKIEEAQ